MTHNVDDGKGPKKEKVFRPAVDALQKVWKVLKKEQLDPRYGENASMDEVSAYRDMLDFCAAIIEKEFPAEDFPQGNFPPENDY